MKSEDIGRIVSVGSPTLSPDQSRVAYVVTRVDLTQNRYRSAIWTAEVSGSTQPRQLTSGDHSDGHPRWSPDGTRLAFTRSHRDDTAEHLLLLLPVDTAGEAVTLVSRNEPVGEIAWSPDGEHIAFTSRVRTSRYSETDERLQPPRRIDRLGSRLDGEGWTIDRPTQAFVVAVDGGGTPRQLTQGDAEIEGPLSWTPDGHALVLVSARHADWDLDVVNDVWLLQLTPDGAAGELIQLTTTQAQYAMPCVSPDGIRLAVVRLESREGYRHGRVAVIDLDRDHRERVLAPDYGFSCFPYGDAQTPQWGADGVLTSVEVGGTVGVVSTALDGTVTTVVGGERWVSGWDAAPGMIVFTASDPTLPSELYVRQGDAAPRQLTRHQREFVISCPVLPVERFSVRSADDTTTIDSWLAAPAGLVEGQRYPALLMIHGGPATQFGSRWFDETQLYASAGFAVIYCNPRGSAGRSEDFARAIRSPKAASDPGGGWGSVDFDDLMSVVDAALQRAPYIDPARLGVLGGSYGGYMTSWIISHSDRFAAACSERACNNLLSEEWSSDAGGYFRFDLGVDAMTEPLEYLRMSPVSYVEAIHTPLLMLHSENDMRCHPEQADSLFVPLRRLRRDVEYHRFTGESHGMSRNGSPRHRQQRADLIREWFDRKLRSAPVTAPVDMRVGVTT